MSKISYFAFKNCIGLSNIILLDSISFIDGFAFWKSGLTCIIIPESVDRLNSDSFRACECLESVIIPRSVKVISWHVFNDCKVLNEIKYGGTMEQWSLINKAEEWHKNVPAKVVHCTDGDVSLD